MPAKRSAPTAFGTFIPTAASGSCSAVSRMPRCAPWSLAEIFMKAASSLLAVSLLAFAAAARPEALHLSNIRQLTSGGQNAEAYWSPDGKRLIFQSTRKPYDCDQIFIMNADGSDLHLVS